LLHDDESIPPPGWHKRFFAWFMHACAPKADHRFQDRKAKLFSCISKGEVAEVAEIGENLFPEEMALFSTSLDAWQLPMCRCRPPDKACSFDLQRYAVAQTFAARLAQGWGPLPT
jgi:hypothetical protein